MIKPNFFIVGQTRSGTTSLKEQLNAHPDIFIYHAGDGFFGYGKSEIKNITQYYELFSKAKNKKIIGEKCTDYLHCPTSAEKIHHFFPNSKILIILRNPVDLMHSLHNKLYNYELLESISDFKEALDSEEKRKLEQRENPDKYHPMIFYRDVADYYPQVKRYVDYFGEKNVKVIINEEYSKNPQKIYKEILNFLTVNDSFVPNFVHHNTNRIPRSRVLQKIMKNNSSNIVKLAKIIPGSSSLYSIINLPKKNRDKIDPILKNELMHEFKPKIQELSKLLNMDFNIWLS